jgi:hypothetical protein
MFTVTSSYLPSHLLPYHPLPAHFQLSLLHPSIMSTTTNFLISILNSLLDMSATSVHVMIMSLYGMLKSDVARSRRRVRVWMYILSPLSGMPIACRMPADPAVGSGRGNIGREGSEHSAREVPTTLGVIEIHGQPHLASCWDAKFACRRVGEVSCVGM